MHCRSIPEDAPCAIQFAQSCPLIALQLTTVLYKYIQGDLSLITDVVRRSDELNGTVTERIVLTMEPSTDTVNQLQTLPTKDHNTSLQQIEHKRKLDEIEVEERLLKLRDKKMTQKEKELDSNISIIERYKQVLGTQAKETKCSSMMCSNSFWNVKSRVFHKHHHYNSREHKQHQSPRISYYHLKTRKSPFP
jgi:hypothetical protein